MTASWRLARCCCMISSSPACLQSKATWHCPSATCSCERVCWSSSMCAKLWSDRDRLTQLMEADVQSVDLTELHRLSASQTLILTFRRRNGLRRHRQNEIKWGQRGSRHDTNEMCVYQTKWQQTGLKTCSFAALGFCFLIHIWRKWFKSKGFLLFLSFFFLGMLYFMQVKKLQRTNKRSIIRYIKIW